MAASGHSEAPAGGSTEPWTQRQDPAVIEIHDSVTECEEEDDEEEEEEEEEEEGEEEEGEEEQVEVRGEGRGDPVHLEEKAFVSKLHSFMKDKGRPIERIPHLGFKQINLWRIFRAVEKRGGYDTVTAQRLWKKVYDELGGSPGSTSAATCTRRHYERLVLPFERHLKGEEDKPLPPSKPRKPYRRNLEKQLKRGRSSELDPQILDQESPEATPHPGPYPGYPDRDICSTVYTLVPVPTPSLSWTSAGPGGPSGPAGPAGPVGLAGLAGPAGPGGPGAQVISPLEKKKRMAQASLSEDKDRPSVIHRPPSPVRTLSGQTCGSSDGSPRPLSSASSSRSPSPLSVSSDDAVAGAPDRPAPASELIQSRRESTWNPPLKTRILDSVWEPFRKDHSPLRTVPTSSFTKVIPKPVQPVRPAPIRPVGHRPVYPDHALTLTRRPSAAAAAPPWFYQPERRDKSRTPFVHSGGPSPLHPMLVPGRTRAPPPQLMYQRVALAPPGLYTYPLGLLGPPPGYALPARPSLFPHRL